MLRIHPTYPMVFTLVKCSPGQRVSPRARCETSDLMNTYYTSVPIRQTARGQGSIQKIRTMARRCWSTSLGWSTSEHPEKIKKEGIPLLPAHSHHSRIKPQWWGWELGIQTKSGCHKGSGSRPFLCLHQGYRGWKDRIAEATTSLARTLGFRAVLTHQNPFSLLNLARQLGGLIPIPPLLTPHPGKMQTQGGERSSTRGIQ